MKFQRPITEVMWATVPFLITMIAALLIITYVPAFTVVPEAERRAPVQNLVRIVEAGLEESRVAIPELALADATGKPLAGEGGKPIVRKFVDCRTAPFPARPGQSDPAAPPSERGGRQVPAAVLRCHRVRAVAQGDGRQASRVQAAGDREVDRPGVERGAVARAGPRE